MSGAPKFVVKSKTSVITFAWHGSADAMGYELYDMFRPVVDAYGDNGDLLCMCKAMGRMLQPLDDVARDGDNGEPGFSQILDPKRCPDRWIPWLGQWVGYFVPPKTTTETVYQWSVRERQNITDKSAHRRGTTFRLTDEVQDFLVGTKAVTALERNPTPNTMIVNYIAAERDPAFTHAQILAAATAQKAAGKLLILNAI